MLTKHSQGNVVGSMYNAMLSQILGVFLAPMILTLLLRGHIGQIGSLWMIVFSLMQIMLLPLAAGQAIRYVFRSKVLAMGNIPEKVSFNVIFIILYVNLSYLMVSDLFYGSLIQLLVPAAASCIMFMTLMYANWLISGAASFPLPDRISIAYTGTQKTLAMGIPLAVLYFSENPEMAGQVSIVIVSYYVFSIFFSAVTIDKLAAAARRKTI